MPAPRRARRGRALRGSRAAAAAHVRRRRGARARAPVRARSPRARLRSPSFERPRNPGGQRGLVRPVDDLGEVLAPRVLGDVRAGGAWTSIGVPDAMYSGSRAGVAVAMTVGCARIEAEADEDATSDRATRSRNASAPSGASTASAEIPAAASFARVADRSSAGRRAAPPQTRESRRSGLLLRPVHGARHQQLGRSPARRGPRRRRRRTSIGVADHARPRCRAWRGSGRRSPGRSRRFAAERKSAARGGGRPRGDLAVGVLLPEVEDHDHVRQPRRPRRDRAGDHGEALVRRPT